MKKKETREKMRDRYEVLVHFVSFSYIAIQISLYATFVIDIRFLYQ